MVLDIVDSRYIPLQVGAGATVGPAPVHDAGAGDAAAGGALHPGRPLLVQVGTLVSCRVVISIRALLKALDLNIFYLHETLCVSYYYKHFMLFKSYSCKFYLADWTNLRGKWACL